MCLAAAALVGPLASSAAAAEYQVKTTYRIGGSGSWDYLTVDAAHHLLFVPRTTHTQVLDARDGHPVADILGQTGNHGVALVPSVGRGFISDGKDASVWIFDLKSYAVLGRIKAQPDADGIIYDQASNRVLLVSGDGGVLIPIAPDVDPAHGSADAAVDLGGKPEFLATDGQGKAFINLNDKDEVAEVDTKTMQVLARWSTKPGGSPVGMSIDREKGRLYIGCRKPQKMIVMDVKDGKVLADLPIGAGVDATQFANGEAFASCRDGTLAVIRETSDGKFAVAQTVQTKVGARTMGMDPSGPTLYLPTAEFKSGGKRPTPKPDTFQILVVAP